MTPTSCNTWVLVTFDGIERGWNTVWGRAPKGAFWCLQARAVGVGVSR